MHLEMDLGHELAELEEQLRLSFPQVQKAVTRALKKTAKWIETHSKRELGTALSLPQRIFSVRFHHSYKLKSGERAVSVWFGLNPIAISQLGKAKQHSTGVRVGRYNFDGAFIATMKSGHEGVFKRKSSSNTRREKRPDGQWTELPIEEERFSIEDIAQPIVERYYVRAEARFKEILQQEINFALNIEVA